MKTKFLLGKSRIVSAAIVLTALAATGCGPKAGSLSGKVTYQGKPLRWGNVVAIWTGGPPGSPNSGTSKLTDDGSYDIGKVPAGGTVQLYVEVPQIPMGGGISSHTPSPEVVKQTKEKLGYEEIPEKYRSAKTSGLSVEIKPGANKFDITIQ